MGQQAISTRIRELLMQNTEAKIESFRSHTLKDTENKERAFNEFEPFSVFVPKQLDKALSIVEEFYEIADKAFSEKSVQLVLDKYEELQDKIHPKMLDYALMVFLTHHPKGRLFSEIIPTLEEREPYLVKSSILTGGVLPSADGLEWYREDPFANEHHEHWHIVYPTGGVPDGNGGREVKDRHGELFFYMHQQMLARYDAERLALKKERVIPFRFFENPITEGYEPNLNGFSKREPNGKWISIDRFNYSVTEHLERKKRLEEAIEKLKFNDGTVVNSDNLGATIESSIATVSESRDSKSYYGNYHGFGHVLTALIPPSTVQNPGVMWSESAAIRDPFFYRWHKHIDDFNYDLQEKLGSHDFKDRPYVKLRKNYIESEKKFLSKDFYICFDNKINPSGDENFDYKKFANKEFGGNQWDIDKDDTEYTTKELTTKFIEREVSGNQIKHLTHEEFVYILKVQNEMPLHQSVTVRIFLCPTEVENDRRMWIELDKFVAELKPNEKSVIVRKGNKSTVVKKPASLRPDLESLSAQIPEEGAFNDDGSINENYENDLNYCTCGWPYHLLIPKGTEKGMAFRIVAVLTDWNIDKVGPGGKCENMSFCGAVDKYPDSRPMGYPFDRPFKLSIKNTIAVNKNFVAKDISIKHQQEEQNA